MFAHPVVHCMLPVSRKPPPHNLVGNGSCSLIFHCSYTHRIWPSRSQYRHFSCSNCKFWCGLFDLVPRMAVLGSPTVGTLFPWMHLSACTQINTLPLCNCGAWTSFPNFREEVLITNLFMLSLTISSLNRHILFSIGTSLIRSEAVCWIGLILTTYEVPAIKSIGLLLTLKYFNHSLTFSVAELWIQVLSGLKLL